MVIIYTVAGVAGFLLSSCAGQYLGFIPIPFLQGASVSVGASASIFGLLGAAVYYGRRSGSRMVGQSGMELGAPAVSLRLLAAWHRQLSRMPAAFWAAISRVAGSIR